MAKNVTRNTNPANVNAVVDMSSGKGVVETAGESIMSIDLPRMSTTNVESSELSEKQKAQMKAIKASGGEAVATKCSHCGKWLVADASIEQEAGAYCSHLFSELGYTPSSLTEHRKSMTVVDVPEGYIKVAALHRLLVQKGIPVSAMVRAFGGDRSLNGPLEPHFKPIYVGNARWLDPWCAGPEGLAYLTALSRTSEGKAAPKNGKVSKQTAEGLVIVAKPTNQKAVEDFIQDAIAV